MDREELKEVVEEAMQSRQAFGQLYDSYQPRVFNFVARRIPNVQDAEDVTQQVFEKVLRAIKDFDPARASFETWLYKITNNTIIDYYRASKVTMDAVETGSPYVFNEREDLERSARYLVLIGLFKELSPVYQEILSLRFIEDKSNKEIADLLGRSNRYVALKVHRGLKSLRGLAVERGLLEKLREGGSTEESD
jgi:RNA polymerase sigma-70 factor (ECF subfamily)